MKRKIHVVYPGDLLVLTNNHEQFGFSIILVLSKQYDFFCGADRQYYVIFDGWKVHATSYLVIKESGFLIENFAKVSF